MHIETLSCHGYEDFFTTVSPKIDSLCTAFFGRENYSFQSAVLEAVCNASRYSVYGEDEADIHFRIYISSTDLKIVILSKTREFDARKFREKLIQPVERKPELEEKNWGEYTKNNENGGRGFWIMLQACQYVIVNYKGQEVTLIAALPDKVTSKSRKIGDLLPRLFIEENGAIS